MSPRRRHAGGATARRGAARVDAILADRAPPRLGISSCLLGHAVRYDGGHKRDRFATDVLGAHVEWVPVCPEVELGLGTPRPSIRLEARGGRLHLVEPRSRSDLTAAMRRLAAARSRALAALDLSGYVLKKDSPSCGLFRVRVWHEAKEGQREAPPPARSGRGFFAEALCARLPLLPVEEEGRLQDAPLRESFVERIFAYRRLRMLFSDRWTRGELVAFHSAHKLQLLAHSEAAYRELGRVVAGASRLPPAELRRRYEEGFMAALAKAATRRRHANVLQHMLGHFRENLDAGARAELAGLIEDYRRDWLPLIVPVTLLRHHAQRLPLTWLRGQTYLAPHPKELQIRNHV